MRLNNAVLPLVIANIIGFMLQVFLGNWFTASFMLVSSDILTRPWIVITSMFLHGSPTHLFFNMYALFMFGTLIEQKIGTKRFLMLYFGAGILAASIPQYSAALGASGAIMGIVGMTIMLLPHMKVLLFFFIPMSMRTAGIIFAGLDIFGLISPLNSGIAHFAHLVGLFAGLGYGYYLLKNKKEFHERFTRVTSTPIKRHSHSNELEMTEKDVEDYIRYGRL
jgi:uncharacterized protein